MYILVFFLYFQPDERPFVLDYGVFVNQAECSALAKSGVSQVRELYGADGAEAICYKMWDFPA